MKKTFYVIIALIINVSGYCQTAFDFIVNANEKIKLQDYSGAIVYCNIAIEIDSKYAIAYYVRGLAKVALKDHRGAIVDCSKAIELILNIWRLITSEDFQRVH
ncbi:MAG: hypothetical protein ABIJ97_13240 [Bacteroidota bacterium]